MAAVALDLLAVLIASPPAPAGLHGAGQLVVRSGGVEADTTVVQYGTGYRALPPAPPRAARPPRWR